MYIVYMAGRPPRQKAKTDARQQLCSTLLGVLDPTWCASVSASVLAEISGRSP